ncbi:hypothetical protein FACS1894186_1580 [Alphaproteobacteria bacterium]|nr:hypothetical protein FACS1894186_1580 [Alphaproteobacteria bacterium]
MAFARALMRLLKLGIYAMVIVAGLLAWRLSQGPISLSRVLPWVISAIAPTASGVKVSARSAWLDAGSLRDPLQIVIKDLMVSDQGDGAVLAQMDDLSMTFNWLALAKGQLAPKTFVISRLDLNLARDLAAPPPAGDTPKKSGKNNIISGMVVKLLSPDYLRYLSRVSIADGTLSIDDFGLQKRLKTAFSAEIARDGRNVNIGAAFTPDSAKPEVRLEVRGQVAYNRQERAIETSLELLPVRPVDSGMAQVLPWLAGVDMEVGGTIKIQSDPRESSFFKGLKKLSFSLHAADGAIHYPMLADNRFRIDRLDLAGSFDRAADLLTVEHGTGAWRNSRADLNLAATGLAHWLDTGDASRISAEFNGSLDSLPMDELPSFWPSPLGADSRAWVMEHVAGGTITNPKFKIVFNGLAHEPYIAVASVDGTTEFDGSTVEYLAKVPKVAGVGGTAHITLDTVDIDIARGTSLGLTAHRARLSFTDLWEPQPLASAQIQASGDLASAIKIIEAPPFAYAQAFGIRSSAVSGTGDVNLRLDFPLRDDLTAAAVKASIRATIPAFTINDLAKGHGLSGHGVNLALTNAGMTMEGAASVAGIPMSMIFKQDFKTGRRTASVVIDTANLPPNIMGLAAVEGSDKIAADIDLTARKLSVSGNLRHTRLAIFPLGYHKPSGTDAPLTFAAAWDARGLLTAWSGSIGGGTTLKIDANRAEIATARTRATAQYSLAKDAATIGLTGDSFDASMLKNIRLSDSGTRGMAITADASVKKLWLSEAGYLTDFTAHIAPSENISATAKTGGGGNTLFSYDRAAQLARLTCDDMGDLLEAAGFPEFITGGRLTATAGAAAGGGWTGRIRARNYYVKNMPTAGKVLSMAGLTSILDILNGDGIKFDRLNIPFAYAPDKRLTIGESIANGSSLGFTMEGSADFAGDRLDLKGSIIPAYAVNSFLGGIPLIGGLFRSEKGGGLLAAGYRITGKPGNPDVSVNPAYALTPGIIKKIFD